jgi:hypothetical protein
VGPAELENFFEKIKINKISLKHLNPSKAEA